MLDAALYVSFRPVAQVGCASTYAAHCYLPTLCECHRVGERSGAVHGSLSAPSSPHGLLRTQIDHLPTADRVWR